MPKPNAGNALEAGLDDPLIHSAIAEFELLCAMLGHQPARSAFASAGVAARRALELDPKRYEASAILGFAQTLITKDAENLAFLDNAVELAPSDMQMRQLRAWAYRIVARPVCETGDIQAILKVKSSARLEDRWVAARIHLMLGRLDEAREFALSVIAAFPFNQQSFLVAAIVEANFGNYQAAIEHVQSICEHRSRDVSQARLLLAYFLGRAGFMDDAETILTEVMSDRRNFRPSAFLVPVTLLLKGPEAAIQNIYQAREHICPHESWMLDALGLTSLREETLAA